MDYHTQWPYAEQGYGLTLVLSYFILACMIRTKAFDRSKNYLEGDYATPTSYIIDNAHFVQVYYSE